MIIVMNDENCGKNCDGACLHNLPHARPPEPLSIVTKTWQVQLSVDVSEETMIQFSQKSRLRQRGDVDAILQVVMLIAGTTARALTSGRRDNLEKALTDKLGYGQQPSKLSIAYAVDVPGLDDQTEVSLHMKIPGGENCRTVAESMARAIRTGEVDEGLRAYGDDGLQARLLAMSGCGKDDEEWKSKAQGDAQQQKGENDAPASGRMKEGGDEISTLRGAATDAGPFHHDSASQPPRGISGATRGRGNGAHGGVKLNDSGSASAVGLVGEGGGARKGSESAIEQVAEATSQVVASRVARDAAREESESIR